MLKIKWTHRITNHEIFQRAKKETFLFKMLINRRCSCIGYIIRHNEFVVNILEGAISGKMAVGRPRIKYLEQFDRHTSVDSCTATKGWLATIPELTAANQSKGCRIRRKKREYSEK
jgi:hypothetical protein